MIRAVVLAQQLALRAGLRALLASDAAIEVAGEAARAAELRQLPPATDLLVAQAEALTLTDLSQLLAGSVAPPGLLLLADDTAALALVEELPLRAWGLLPSSFEAEELLAAAHAVAAGLIVGTSALIGPLISRPLSAPQVEIDEQLTARELEVLALLAQGLSNKQIALALGISDHTVKFHLSSIFAKLGAASRTEAVRLGNRLGLVTL